MTTLSFSDVTQAARIADQLADTLTERTLLYKLAIVSHSIIAIDKTPTHLVMGSEIPPTLQFDHMNPPRFVRQLNAIKLFDFINEHTKTQLGDKLYDAYLDKIDNQGVVRSYLDDPKNKRVRWICREEGCDEELFIPPRYAPGTNDIIVPHCKWHGTHLEMVGRQEDEESPLA